MLLYRGAHLILTAPQEEGTGVQREVSGPRSCSFERQSRAMDQGRLAPEALLFSSRFYCLSAEGWLCEPCVYVCVCVCVCVCSSKRTGGGKGQEPLLRRHPHPIPRPPRSVSIQVLGRSRWKGMPFSPPLPKHIYSCGGRLGGDCLDHRNDLGQGHTALVPH